MRSLIRAGGAGSRPVARVERSGFDDPDFLELCALVHGLRNPAAGRSVVRHTLAAVPRSGRFLRSLRRLPRQALELTGSPEGERLRSYFRRRLLDRGLLVAISTLTLTSDVEDYRRGRHRQALRTNCSRALRAGLTVAQLDDPDGERARMLDFFERRADPDGAAPCLRRAASGEGEFWFAVAPDGRLLALAEVVTDDRAALLQLMISAAGANSSDARYLLMAELLRSLSGRGVRHVVAGRTLSLPPGLLYFQRLLGFVPTNLTLAIGGPAAPGR